LPSGTIRFDILLEKLLLQRRDRTVSGRETRPL
jgi:hypothetical protein